MLEEPLDHPLTGRAFFQAAEPAATVHQVLNSIGHGQLVTIEGLLDQRQGEFVAERQLSLGLQLD